MVKGANTKIAAPAGKKLNMAFKGLLKRLSQLINLKGLTANNDLNNDLYDFACIGRAAQL